MMMQQMRQQLQGAGGGPGGGPPGGQRPTPPGAMPMGGRPVKAPPGQIHRDQMPRAGIIAMPRKM
jgi:hypothetical protein